MLWRGPATVVRTFLAIAVLALVSAIAACRTEVPPVPLRIGLNIWPGYGAFFIADAKGLYAGQKVPVKLEIIQGDAEREQALIAGKLDGIGMTIDNLVRLRGKGLKLKAIFKYDDSYGADGMVAKRDIKSVTDLKGKSVAYALGTPSHFFLTQILGEYRLTTKDLRSVAMSPDDAGAAFVSGKLDAAVTWEPWLSKAKTTPAGHVLVTTRERPVIQDVLFVSEDVLAKRRQDLIKFLRACFDAVEYWQSHRDEGNQIIAKALNLPLADVEAMLSGIRVTDRRANLAFFGTRQSPGPAFQAYRDAVAAWLQEGLITAPEDPAAGLEPELVHDVGK